ncbi:hypothetical protein COLO4_23283 [Corchorus olitorius]|uniref:Uncharacterized protein n=1 Tax=Corchorus olitorius TaxID=93759 RepID=A0A1R3IHH3_9ROSI|nr:hypothetical protein COLO4_23283 [Corchorus olitorius]
MGVVISRGWLLTADTPFSPTYMRRNRNGRESITNGPI